MIQPALASAPPAVATPPVQDPTGHDLEDPTSLRHALPDDWPSLALPKRLRVGFDEAWTTTDVAPAVEQSMREALAAIEAVGAEVVPVTVPLLAEASSAFGVILLAEMGVAHRRFYPKQAEDYGRGMRAMLEHAACITVDQVVQGQQLRAAFATAIAELFTHVDVLITPVDPINAPALDQEEAVTGGLHLFRFTYPWNLVGAPALALPWGSDENGLPNSVQVIGPVLQDTLVLAVAGAIERPTLRPPSHPQGDAATRNSAPPGTRQ